jgi:hypothetical protein
MISMVDSYRFLDGIAKYAMRQWSGIRATAPIQWTPLAKPLSQSRIAIVSSAALALNSDPPFDVEIERLDPWFSDASYRVLPRGTRTGAVQICHLHINPAFAQQDLNCVMPLERLAELVALREVATRRCRIIRMLDIRSVRNGCYTTRYVHCRVDARRARRCGRAGAGLTGVLLVRRAGPMRARKQWDSARSRCR